MSHSFVRFCLCTWLVYALFFQHLIHICSFIVCVQKIFSKIYIFTSVMIYVQCMYECFPNVLKCCILIVRKYVESLGVIAIHSYIEHWISFSLKWHHNGRNGISNHQPHDCLLSRLFRHRSEKISKLCLTGLCVGNSSVTGEFPGQMASNAEKVSIWWRHHVIFQYGSLQCLGKSLWPCNDIWRHGSLSTLAHIMACWLTTLDHYQNQHWFFICDILWHSPAENSPRNVRDISC